MLDVGNKRSECPMKMSQSISDLPAKPAVYALYGSAGSKAYVAYVGVTSDLKSRIAQHLIRHDSSVTSGTSAATLNPDFVTEVRWWRANGFHKKVRREAAEIIAIRVLDPALRSRGKTTGGAQTLADDPEFRAEMETLFKGSPEGQLILPDLQDALDRIADLEARVRALESKLKQR
jgi:hypothetical protein